MTFFKIIRDGNIISVGNVFLKWNEKRHRMHVCDVNEGQFVQTFDEQNIYTASWLKPAPKGVNYENAEVVIISNTEYNDLKAELEEVEVVPIETIIPEEYPIEEPQEEPEEKPMSIAKMREIIAEQQEQIKFLMELINSK